MATLPKNQRLAICCERLFRSPPFCSCEEAYLAVSTTLTAVEDEFSGIPNNPSAWQTDGRLYPPQQDTKRAVPQSRAVFRYRSVAHNTFIAKNGSIRIETITGDVLLNKPGADGLAVADFERGGLTMQERAGYGYNAMDEQLQRFHSMIRQRLPEAIVELDGTQEIPSHCWVDIRFGPTLNSVEYRSGYGFGIFGEAPGYGEGPATICKIPEDACVKVAALFDDAASIRRC